MSHTGNPGLAAVAARHDAPVPAGRAVVAVLGVGAFAVGTNMFVVPGVLVELAADLDVPVTTAGTVVTAFALSYAVGAVCSGSVLGGRPLRPVLVASVALAGMSAVAAATAPTFPVLVVARVLGALAAACFLPAAGAATVAAVPEEHRGRALAALLVAGSAAMLVGAPSASLLGGWLGWRAAFGLVAALAAVAVAGLLRCGAGIAGVTGSARRARRPVVRAPVLGLLAVTTAVVTGSNALLTYLGAVVLTGHPVALAPVLALFGLGGVVGSWWGGSATDRRGGRVVARRTTAALLVTFAVFPLLAPTVVGLLAVTVAWGAAVWALVPAQQHRLVHLDPDAAPVLLALHGAAVHLGFATGALLGGLVVHAAGADHVWLVAVAGCAAGLTLHTLLTKETS